MADTKRCTRCKLEKPKSEFNKNKQSQDGLSSHCKKCRQYYNAKYIALKSERLKKPSAPHTKYRSDTEWSRLVRDANQRRAQGENVENVTAKGIDSLSQVNDVLREISELQYKIDHENNLCDNRVKMLREYTEVLIEQDLCHQLSLYMMLKKFFEQFYKNKIKVNKYFRFGSICFSKNKLDIKLMPERANMAFDKP